jgi:plastocyanin
MCIGGSTATASGLVFAGEGNGNFDALDAKSGQHLWQFQTGAGVNAPAVTYEVDGMQYVAVSSGGNFQLDFPRGDTLWVFSLNGTQEPVAAPPPPTSTVQPSAIAVNHVNIVDFAFAPATIEVPPGTTVTWTEQGPTAHTATSDNGVWDSGLLQKGQSFSYTFNTPGTYDYFCVPHPFMRSRVIVRRTRRHQRHRRHRRRSGARPEHKSRNTRRAHRRHRRHHRRNVAGQAEHAAVGCHGWPGAVRDSRSGVRPRRERRMGAYQTRSAIAPCSSFC